MPVRIAAVLFAAIAATAAAAARAQQPAAPPSPTLGDVILLANSTDSGVPEALRSALGSSDPVPVIMTVTVNFALQ